MIEQTEMYRQIRKQLIERLGNTMTTISPESVEKMSLYQIVGLLHLFFGQLNYLPTFTLAVRTLVELLGEDQVFERLDSEPPKIEEPKPAAVVH